VYTAICVQYRAGATAAQAKKHRDRNSISKHKASISYIDIEGAFIDIEKTSISGYNDIEVLNFDTDVSLTSCWVDIEVPDLDIDVYSISNCVDIDVSRFDVEDSSISYWIDIVCYNIRYRLLSDFKLAPAGTSRDGRVTSVVRVSA
jgi:hypothetical protein